MNHAKRIKWREAKSVASLVSQAGNQIITGYEGKAGVNFSLTFNDKYADYLDVYWWLANDDETIVGCGSITISKATKAVIDYDGCFYLASEITKKLKSLGYDVTELELD